MADSKKTGYLSLIDYQSRGHLRPPIAVETTIVIDAKDFSPEGDDCEALLMVEAYRLVGGDLLYLIFVDKDLMPAGSAPEQKGSGWTYTGRQETMPPAV